MPGPVAPGATSTYGLVTGIKLDIEDLIQLLSPTDIPMQGMARGATGTVNVPTDTITEKKYQWMDEAILTPRTTIAATSTTGDGFIVVASGDGLKFQTGDVVLVGSEYMRVTGYGTTTDSITVSRAYSGSAATVATGADVVGVGSALPEGSIPPAARFLDRNNRQNFSEIFGPVAVQSTNSDLAIQKYGITNEFDHQVANRLKEVAIGIDQAAVYGVQVEDTTNKWRSMGGMHFYITTNVDSTTSTSITQAAINTQLQTVYGAGGNPEIIMVGAKQKGVISTFSSSGTIQVQRGDGTAGRVISRLETDFANLEVILNRWMRVSDADIFARDQLALCTLRPVQYQPLAITGDSRPGMIVGEKGFKVYRQIHAARFSALT